MSVDYGTNQLSLSRSSNAEVPTVSAGPAPPDGAPRSGVSVPIRTTASGFLSGEVFIDGIKKPLNFIIDTGATVTVLSERTAAMEEAQPFITRGKMRVFGAAGVADDVKIALLPRVAIGAHSRERVDAAVLDLDSVNETAGFLQNGILGGNFLRHYRITFDFQRGSVRFESLESKPAPKTNSPPNTLNQ